MHVLVTGEHEGYYEDYGSVADVGARVRAPARRTRLVVCAQNHDQVGNRAFGDRLPGERAAAGRRSARSSLPASRSCSWARSTTSRAPSSSSPTTSIPRSPEATREGRRREFERFAAFAGEDVPDPQSVETFLRSKLDRAHGDADHRRYYRALLALRRRIQALPVEAVTSDEAHRVLRVRRGPVELVMNFSGDAFEEVPPWTGVARGAEGLAG